MPNQIPRRDRAVADLAAHCLTLPAAEIVDRLTTGLTQLRDLLIRRLHDDMVRIVTDSMLAPTSGSQQMTQIERASHEIDAYAAVVVADEVTQGGYLGGPGEWFLDWTIKLRADDGHESDLKRIADPYSDLPDKDRRLRLASKLQHAVPESIRAPAVLYHLFPLSVRIVAAMAFGNTERAEQKRSEQLELLPAIGDCGACHGRVLGNGASCGECGNPLWNFEWLRVV